MSKKKKCFRIRIKPLHPGYEFEVSTFLVYAPNQEIAEAKVVKVVENALKRKEIEGSEFKITLCKEIKYEHILNTDWI